MIKGKGSAGSALVNEIASVGKRTKSVTTLAQEKSDVVIKAFKRFAVHEQRIRHVCVFRQLGGIGDFLMLTPVFRGLKEKYPGCYITLATDTNYMAGALPMLARGNPFIDQTIRINPFTFVCSPTRHLRREFKDVPNDPIPHCVLETDLVIDLNVICAHTETAQQPNVVDHRTDIWCRAAGVEPSSKKPILVLNKDELREGRDWCDRTLGEGVRVGVVLSSMSPARDWPYGEEFSAELCRLGYRVCTIDRIRRGYNKIPTMLGMQIRQVAAAIAHLDLVISPDTGILHVAGAMGTPVLGIFGSTDGRLRMREYAGSYVDSRRVVSCGPCWYLNPCRKDEDKNQHYICLKRITPTFVQHEMEMLLESYNRELPKRQN
jgi:hypothetical protein